MWNRKHSVTLSIIICFIIAAVITIFVVMGPWLVELWFARYRGWSEDSKAIKDMVVLFSACFYPSAVFGYITLYSLIHLLFDIYRNEIFIDANVLRLKVISWCCFAVAVITFAGGLFYAPFLFISVAAGFIGLMLRIIKNVMQNAVALREESDLTI